MKGDGGVLGREAARWAEGAIDAAFLAPGLQGRRIARVRARVYLPLWKEAVKVSNARLFSLSLPTPPLAIGDGGAGGLRPSISLHVVVDLIGSDPIPDRLS